MSSVTASAGPAMWSRRSFLIACSLVPLVRPAQADGAAVAIRQFSFAPGEIEIVAGTTVTFTNFDLVPHTATGEGFDTGTLKKGESRAIAFAVAGDFPYLCMFHRHMKGRVRVR